MATSVFCKPVGSCLLFTQGKEQSCNGGLQKQPLELVQKGIRCVRAKHFHVGFGFSRASPDMSPSILSPPPVYPLCCPRIPPSCLPTYFPHASTSSWSTETKDWWRTGVLLVMCKLQHWPGVRAHGCPLWHICDTLCSCRSTVVWALNPL